MLKFFRIPFAASGDKAPVPDAVDVNGFVSYTAGYGFDYQRQKTDPAAKNIERDKMNEIFFDITTALGELQGQGVPDFITSALNGGTAYSYSQYAIVRYSGDLYISLVNTNTALPSDATKWALLPTPYRIQSQAYTSAAAGGTADAITGAFSPVPLVYPAAPGTLKFLVRAGSANATAIPTFTPNSGTLAAKTIVKGNNLPLVAGDIAGAGHWLELVYDATLDKFVLGNPAKGVNVAATVPQIQSVSSSVAANALTLGYAGGTLDFRNATLSNGAPIVGTAVGPLSLVVPSGATLGTINGQQSRLVLLVAYNGGSPVLCVTNIAGAASLDETNLISPTTISAGATSASAIYSASAVSANSPYRVIGFVDITEATAGTWATDATTKQGIGGLPLAAIASIGYGQTWQSVTRNNGVTYYNTTGRPLMFIFGQSSAGAGNFALTVNGVALPTIFGWTSASAFGGGAIIIPVGASYSISLSVGTANCAELR